jgi:hypothetical protein
MKYTWVGAAALLALTACGDEAAEPISTETGGEAAGEILGGTISDEMIPLEELTSTSPPAQRRADTSSGVASNDAPTAGQEATAPAAATEPTGPVTAGPGQPASQTQEAGEPSIDPPAF